MVRARRRQRLWAVLSGGLLLLFLLSAFAPLVH